MSRTTTFRFRREAAFALLVSGAVVATGCGSAKASRLGVAGDAAEQVYVAPGKYDEFYAFMSGGFDGQVGVYGLPSGRLLKHVPVFSQSAENGWGYSEQTKAMLNTSYGFVPWDDAHHPQLSQTDGVPDGRWLFINGNNTPRIARLDLTRFETEEILEIPNSGRQPRLAVHHARTRVHRGGRRGSACRRRSADVSDRRLQGELQRHAVFIKVDSATGKMDIAFQILMPGFDYDLVARGQGPVARLVVLHHLQHRAGEHQARGERLAERQGLHRGGQLEAGRAVRRPGQGEGGAGPLRPQPRWTRTASRGTDWGSERQDARPRRTARVSSTSCRPRSRPHGVDVDPTGEYIVAGGKLATVIPVHSLLEDAEGDRRQGVRGRGSRHPGAQVRGHHRRRSAEARPRPAAHGVRRQGLRLHLDVHLSSEIVKWRLKDFKVLDRMPTYYSIGHLMIPGGDSRKPWGKYVARAQQDHQGPLPAHRPGAGAVGAALRHQRRQDEAAARLPDDRRAALRAGAAGGAHQGPPAQDVSADEQREPVRRPRTRSRPGWTGRAPWCT